jgi:hypothetical protein
VTFRDRLVATIREARPVLELPDILVVGSEVPNLLEPDVAATLVVSLDLDIGVPVERHASVKAALDDLAAFHPSPEEPSVWVPRRPELLEINLLGIDRARTPLVLSARDGMPDPAAHRERVAAVLARLEAVDGDTR